MPRAFSGDQGSTLFEGKGYRARLFSLEGKSICPSRPGPGSRGGVAEQTLCDPNRGLIPKVVQAPRANEAKGDQRRRRAPVTDGADSFTRCEKKTLVHPINLAGGGATRGVGPRRRNSRTASGPACAESITADRCSARSPPSLTPTPGFFFNDPPSQTVAV